MRYAIAFTLVPALWLSTAAHAAQGGPLRTMPQGYYECAMPGDASTVAWQPVDGAHFTIDNASSYETENGRGTYLLTGKTFIFTRGPLKGKRFQRISDNALRAENDDGSLSRMRCIRTTR